ncbi:MAG: hypothetical protein AVDCRST_MAG40-3085, partial [uncultured Gemmatimonadaceae bacterium]
VRARGLGLSHRDVYRGLGRPPQHRPTHHAVHCVSRVASCRAIGGDSRHRRAPRRSAGQRGAARARLRARRVQRRGAGELGRRAGGPGDVAAARRPARAAGHPVQLPARRQPVARVRARARGLSTPGGGAAGGRGALRPGALRGAPGAPHLRGRLSRGAIVGDRRAPHPAGPAHRSRRARDRGGGGAGRRRVLGARGSPSLLLAPRRSPRARFPRARAAPAARGGAGGGRLLRGGGRGVDGRRGGARGRGAAAGLRVRRRERGHAAVRGARGGRG